MHLVKRDCVCLHGAVAKSALSKKHGATQKSTSHITSCPNLCTPSPPSPPPAKKKKQFTITATSHLEVQLKELVPVYEAQ